MYKLPLFWFSVLVFVGAAAVVMANFGWPAWQFPVFVVNSLAKATDAPSQVVASFLGATIVIMTNELVKFACRTRKGVQQV